jgi:hypothetical protein
MIVYDASQAGLVELQSARKAIDHRTLWQARLAYVLDCARLSWGKCCGQPPPTSHEGDAMSAYTRARLRWRLAPSKINGQRTVPTTAETTWDTVVRSA